MNFKNVIVSNNAPRAIKEPRKGKIESLEQAVFLCMYQVHVTGYDNSDYKAAGRNEDELSRERPKYNQSYYTRQKRQITVLREARKWTTPTLRKCVWCKKARIINRVWRPIDDALGSKGKALVAP
ncbi:jg1027 [Pararge aegeria aegeria]|uniref:Jg1027 protein n=1 Tax=Pararge aegeria aegeria TaxID=348720 RepID=A0A8S4SH55_9NEOP|nr:jg1027 [Pararge aegeria aegeria]